MLPHAIATGNIHSGTIAGKLNGVMPAHDAERLAQRVVSTPVPTVLGVFALEQVRDAARELDDLEPALHLAFRIGQHLAVFAGDDRGQLGLVAIEQLAESVEDAGAAQRRRRCPCGKGGRSRIDGAVDVGLARETHPACGLTRRGMVNGAEAAGTRLNRLAADKKGNSLGRGVGRGSLGGDGRISGHREPLLCCVVYCVPEIPHIYGDLYRDGARSSGRCNALNGSLFTSSTIFA